MTRFEPTATLQDIVPEARPHFERLMTEAEARGISLKIRAPFGAGRTCAMQQELLGRGPGTTTAGMCRSLHVVGRALDFDAWPNDCATYTRLGELWESWGGTWGGRWTNYGACGDAGHFHWLPGHQSTPESICPRGLTLDECEVVREDYLSAQFGPSKAAIFGALAVVGGAAVAAWVWFR